MIWNIDKLFKEIKDEDSILILEAVKDACILRIIELK